LGFVGWAQGLGVWGSGFGVWWLRVPSYGLSSGPNPTPPCTLHHTTYTPHPAPFTIGLGFGVGPAAGEFVETEASDMPSPSRARRRAEAFMLTGPIRILSRFRVEGLGFGVKGLGFRV